MNRTAIIAAMAGELKPFLNANAKEGWTYERRGNVKLWRLIWPLTQGEWIAVCAGAGVAAATRAFAEAENYGPLTSVISTGWAGALSEEYKPGQAYSVSEVADARTGERFRAVAGAAACLLVTSATVAGEAEKQRLAAAYGPGLVDMEASAIARLAAMRGIPFYCCKGVSDGFTDRLPDFNGFIAENGTFQLARFIVYVLIRPGHWPALIRMGENSKKAAHAIGESLLEILDKEGLIRKRNV
jgi:adenosylhomocysteine nucleosidase